MAKRATHHSGGHSDFEQADDPRLHRWNRPLEITIAIALGLAAIVTAGSVYLNEKQEHKATLGFNEAIHLITAANAEATQAIAARPAEARRSSNDAIELDHEAEQKFLEAAEKQERATRYTLIEVVLASALFLFGVAGLARTFTIKVGALGAGATIFATAVILFAVA
ncbi:MAG: hypothetical protein EXQ70_07075 [Solirubrobacterales bacterium]|nr:hypothetical protein [Solirubrobacterales bacterium]